MEEGIRRMNTREESVYDHQEQETHSRSRPIIGKTRTLNKKKDDRKN